MSDVRARFFADERGRDFVEISIIGDPNTVLRKAEPKDIERFDVEWNAYKIGKPEIDYGGTPLSEVPGLDEKRAIAWRLQGIHNVEELAALSDGAAKALGMGGITIRDTARLVLRAKGVEFKQTPFETPREVAVIEEVKRKRGRPPKKRPDEMEIDQSDLAPIEE